MKAKRLSFVTAACVAALCTTSFAYTISGTVSDDQGKLIKDVDVTLLKEGKTTKTDDQGKFTIHEDEITGLNQSYKNSVGYIGINNGILSYSQSSTSPVQVKIYNSLGAEQAKRRLNNFRNNLAQRFEKEADGIAAERNRMMRAYEKMRDELKTYENNLGFLTSSSKKGNTLVDTMKKRVEKLRDELNLLAEKIKAVDEQMKNEGKEAGGE